MHCKKIKLLIAIFTTVLTTTAYATAPGFYLGIQGGMTNVNNKPVVFPTGGIAGLPPTVAATPSNTGFGVRFYLGDNLTKYFGLEFGFTHYGSSTYNPTSGVIFGKPQIKVNSLDLVGKGMMPLGPLDVFAKGGMAVMYTSASGSIVDTVPAGTTGAFARNSTTVHPTVAIGASYDLTQHWVAELTASEVFSNSKVQSATMISLGISYHFVDEYCGQFLC